jgi:hypothetical protein
MPQWPVLQATVVQNGCVSLLECQVNVSRNPLHGLYNTQQSCKISFSCLYALQSGHILSDVKVIIEDLFYCLRSINVGRLFSIFCQCVSGLANSARSVICAVIFFSTIVSIYFKDPKHQAPCHLFKFARDLICNVTSRSVFLPRSDTFT